MIIIPFEISLKCCFYAVELNRLSAVMIMDGTADIVLPKVQKKH